VSADPDITRQRDEVAAQREQLGRTIAELADRVDVPARAKERTAVLRARLSASAPVLILGAVALVSAAVSVVAFRRWWRDRRAPREHA
jgi:hypothetical protein